MRSTRICSRESNRRFFFREGNTFLFDLAPGGVWPETPSLTLQCALTALFHPYPDRVGTVWFLFHYSVTQASRPAYPPLLRFLRTLAAPCLMEFGLSSPAKGGRDYLVCFSKNNRINTIALRNFIIIPMRLSNLPPQLTTFLSNFLSALVLRSNSLVWIFASLPAISFPGHYV